MGMVHEEFGGFRLAFEHVHVCVGPESLNPSGFHPLHIYVLTLSQGHTYNIKKYRDFSTVLNPHLPANMQVEFQSSTGIDLPSPELLKMHCAIATYLDASGMGKQVDDMLSEEEEGEAEPINLVDPNFEGVVDRVTDWLVTVR